MTSFYKCIALTFLSLLHLSLAFSQQPSVNIQQELRQRQQQKPILPNGVSDNWYNQAMTNIALREYNLKELNQGRYASFNRKQQLGFQFTEKGYQVKGVDIDHDLAINWEANFELQGVGRSGRILLPARNGITKKEEEQLRFQYKGFIVEYLNTEKGMRQNFIIQQKPGGSGALKVWTRINSSLQAGLPAETGLVLHTPGNPRDIKLRYDELKVWDADNHLLKAHMELSKDQSLAIVVDDQNAKYPITIDPLNHSPDWTDNGNGLLFPLVDGTASLHLLFGFSVSGAGDVNNDGIDDIIVGAPAFVDIVTISPASFNLVSVGAAFVYYGNAIGPSATPSEALQPTSFAGALFGFSVSKAGDLNDDNIDDLVIGAPGDHINLTVGLGSVSVGVGKVYIYYGGANFNGSVNSEPAVSLSLTLSQADFGILATVPANPLYGFSVSNAGDVNNDTYDDIIVGSPAYANIATLSLGGRVDIYTGSSTGLDLVPHEIGGPMLPALFGYSVSTAGRVNNDLFDDVIVGAPASLSLLSVGAAYVFHGSAAGVTANLYTGAATTLQAPGLLSSTLFGFSVSDAGDVNGDGRGDVIVGEPLSLETTLALELVAVGKATIFYGSNTGITATLPTSLTSPRRPNLLGLLQGNLLYGFSVSGAGDLNCDGLSDVIVGEPGGTAISLGTGVLGLVSANALSGKAYVYYGRAGNPVNSPSYIVQETGPLAIANLLGASVSDAGDVNGDGNADFLIGAPNGTLSFASSLTGVIGGAIGYITQNSVGSAYGYFGCLTLEDLDFDNDGIPDAIDLDDDNDGTPDLNEYPGITLTQDPADDSDGDGIPNYMDPDFTDCAGLNGAGVCTAFDKDGDGIPNSFDLDADNDGIPDVIEAGGVDADGDGVLDNFTDTDNDGLSQSIDANNTGAAGSGAGLGSTGTPDFDADGIPNSYDLDSDGDGITDLREAGLPDADNNAMIDAFADSDGDGFADTVDPKEGHGGVADPAGTGTPALTTPTDTNADGHYDGNPATGNHDADALFNFLDLDADNDGITDNVEGQSTAGYILPGTGDTDGDGLANAYDSEGGVYTAGGIIPNNQEFDADPDYLDDNADNDTAPDILEGHDSNGNGIPDDNTTLSGLDDDNDGIDNTFDLITGPNPTTAGIGNPPIPGARGPLQASSGIERDWRNGLFVLPLKLISFTAARNESRVELEWVSTNEENFNYFEIERSVDGSNFTAIGRVTGTGTISGNARYRFTDAQAASSKSFYRLRLVDRDSRFNYSQTLFLSDGNGRTGINVFPNPVHTQLQLEWKGMSKGNYSIELISTAGLTINRYVIKINSSDQVLLLPRGSNWKTGAYLLRIIHTDEGTIITKRVIIN